MTVSPFFAHYDGSGNGDLRVEMDVQTKVVLEYDLVDLAQRHGDKPHRGDVLGSLPELYPFDLIKRPLLAHTEEFVRQIGTKGYEPVGSIYAFKVWGPYMEKVGEMREWTPEEGNHTIPRHLQKKAEQVWSYGSNELDWSKGCAFIIVGKFSRAAKHGVISEESGVLVL